MKASSSRYPNSSPRSPVLEWNDQGAKGTGNNYVNKYVAWIKKKKKSKIPQTNLNSVYILAHNRLFRKIML